MSYATLQTLIDQFGADEVTRSADRDADGVADTDVVEQALADADGIIDSRVAVKYKLPLNPVPDVLVAYAGDIALYRMSYDAGTLTDEKRRRYDDALRWLDQVASGKAVLGGQPEPDTKTAGGIRMTAAPREFTYSKARGML
jgi:phage gp36-like protein